MTGEPTFRVNKLDVIVAMLAGQVALDLSNPGLVAGGDAAAHAAVFLGAFLGALGILAGLNGRAR